MFPDKRSQCHAFLGPNIGSHCLSFLSPSRLAIQTCLLFRNKLMTPSDHETSGSREPTNLRADLDLSTTYIKMFAPLQLSTSLASPSPLSSEQVISFLSDSSTQRLSIKASSWLLILS